MHELQSGTTSSISQQIIGFDAAGGLVNSADASFGTSSAADVAERAVSLVTLLDLCGQVGPCRADEPPRRRPPRATPPIAPVVRCPEASRVRQRHHGAVRAAVQPCSRAAVQPCSRAAVQPCSRAAVLPCCRAHPLRGRRCHRRAFAAAVSVACAPHLVLWLRAL